MIIKNVSEKDISRALELTNITFDNNIAFNSLQQKGKSFNVTLRVKKSKGKGARLGFRGRHLISACWHAHGVFFDNLLKVNPNAVIKTAFGKIDKLGGNWIDYNVGSVLYPRMLSEMCECDFDAPHPQYRFEETFITEPFEVFEDATIKQKVWQDYEALDNFAKALGYKTPQPDNDPEFCGWIATLGDEDHDPIQMLKECMEKFKKAKEHSPDAILGFCRTGKFSIGYTIYVK